jgi:hypothetical protein
MSQSGDRVARRLVGESADGFRAMAIDGKVCALAMNGRLNQPVVAYSAPLTASQPALRVIDGGASSGVWSVRSGQQG